MTRSTRSASTTSRSTASRAALWLVLSMITDLSANSHSDAENDDNEHNNGDGSTTPASRSTSPASGAAQNSTRSTQRPQDPPQQEGPHFSLSSAPRPAGRGSEPTSGPLSQARIGLWGREWVDIAIALPRPPWLLKAIDSPVKPQTALPTGPRGSLWCLHDLT